MRGYPYDAAVIFRNYPTGFAAFPIGWDDTTCLVFCRNSPPLEGISVERTS